MWLCTQLGFFSIVRKQPYTFHIRARCLADLNMLSNSIGLPSLVAPHPGSDCSWRISCDAGDLTRLFALISARINYGNFKSAAIIVLDLIVSGMHLSVLPLQRDMTL